MRIPVTLEEQVWSQIISIIANSDPRIADISSQVVTFKRQMEGNGYASEGISERPHQRANPSRFEEEITSSNRGDSPEQRPPGPAKR